MRQPAEAPHQQLEVQRDVGIVSVDSGHSPNAVFAVRKVIRHARLSRGHHHLPALRTSSASLSSFFSSLFISLSSPSHSLSHLNLSPHPSTPPVNNGNGRPGGPRVELRYVQSTQTKSYGQVSMLGGGSHRQSSNSLGQHDARPNGTTPTASASPATACNPPFPSPKRRPTTSYQEEDRLS